MIRARRTTTQSLSRETRCLARNLASPAVKFVVDEPVDPAGAVDDRHGPGGMIRPTCNWSIDDRRAGRTVNAPGTTSSAVGSGTGRSGFDEFYRADYGRLTMQLYAYLGDAAEAEDVVQEAYLRAWQRWAAVSMYDDPVAWIRRVAWHLATSRLRRLTVAARALRRQRTPDTVAPVGPERVALVRALRTLPDRQRQAVVLHYLGDLPVAEVAMQLGAPRGTVVSWLARARVQLATLLSESPDNEGLGCGD